MVKMVEMVEMVEMVQVIQMIQSVIMFWEVNMFQVIWIGYKSKRIQMVEMLRKILIRLNKLNQIV